MSSRLRAEQVGSLLRPPDLAGRAIGVRGRADRSRGASFARGRRHPSGCRTPARCRRRRLRGRRDAPRVVADRDGRRRRRLRSRQHPPRMARPGRRRREDDGENRRQPAAQAADADGTRTAAAQGDWRRAVQDHAAGAVELRADRIQAWRDRPALQGPRRTARRPRRHRSRRSAVAGQRGRHVHSARRAFLFALPRSAAPRRDAAGGRRSGCRFRGRRRRRQRRAGRMSREPA